MKLLFDNKQYNLIRTLHTFNTRNKDNIERTRYFSDRMFEQVIKLSFARGLTSYRNKGEIAITFFDTLKRQITILCVLDDKNVITLITVWAEYKAKNFITHFKKAKNRIFLDTPITPATKEEIDNNKKNKFMYEAERSIDNKEDNMFNNYMRKSK